jgi:hypothetical protein
MIRKFTKKCLVPPCFQTNPEIIHLDKLRGDDRMRLRFLGSVKQENPTKLRA